MCIFSMSENLFDDRHVGVPRRALPLDKAGGLRPGEMKVVGGGFGILLGLRGDGAMSCYGSAPWQRIGCGKHPSHEIRRHWVGMGRGDSTSATEAAVWIWWRLHN